MVETQKRTPPAPIGLLGESDEVIARYWELVDNGQSHSMAEILATRQAPGIETDSTYFAGSKKLGDVWGEEHTQQIVNDARKHGYNPNSNDVYNPTAARFRGDPEAFVSPTDGRETIKKLARRRGIESEELGTKASDRNRERLASRSRNVAPDIVRNEIRNRLINKDVDKPKRMVEDAVNDLTLRPKKRGK